MKMLYTSLTQLHFQDNQRIKHDICNLEFSIPFQSILKHLDKKATTSDKPACVYIYGEPGCGRSSVLLDICEKSIQRKLLASKVCGLRVRKGCTLESLWNLLSEIAKERKDRETASTLTNSKVKLSKKYKVAQAFISANFQLICVDDASADGGIVWSHLSKLLNKTNIGVALVSSEQECNFPFKEEIKDWQLLSVKVKGLNVQSFTLNVREFYSSLKLNEEMISKIHCILNGNPRAVDILINVFREFNLPDKSLHCVFLSLENDGMVHEIGKDDLNPILLVLQFVFEHLTAFEKRVYSQLCHLREPLPVIHLSKEAEKLIRLGLVTNQASSLCSSKQAINLASISVAQCFQLSAAQLLDFSAEDEAPSTFELWYALLSSKLQTLIADAERNAWPFVPEKWQYSSSVGPEERYNIKDLLTAKNYTAPLLNELDIMEECLFHAMKEKRYRTVGALVFVMDRFTYWQGMSNRTLQLVEYLKTNSPDIPIAPQLLIRNVRIMKNAGNLQGAEKALDDLLDQKAQIGKWVYQTEHDRQLVSAVCFQIKGDIQYNLGQWTRGAKHLMDSVVLFSSLPIPDTKGISSSLAILGNCLQRMSVTEYLPVCHMYGLTASHPLLQAYYCSCEAARRSQYTPLFYARHKCQAGERLLHYSKVIPCGATRKNCLIVSIQDFKDSIQAHKDPEFSPEWTRTLHAIHPVTAVQIEWSLVTRNLVEEILLDCCKELGIAIVAYSPLARNLLAAAPTEVPTDWRKNQPRYSEENLKRNQELLKKIEAMAESKKCSAAQLSLAWLYFKAGELGLTMIAIPGTTKIPNAEANFAALRVTVTKEEATLLEELGAQVAGNHGNEAYENMGLEGNMKKVSGA